MLAGVGPACCALARPRRNLRFVKSEWLRRRGLSLLIPGDAAGFSVVCTNRPPRRFEYIACLFRRARGVRTQFCTSGRWNLRRNPWLATNQRICASRARGDKNSRRSPGLPSPPPLRRRSARRSAASFFVHPQRIPLGDGVFIPSSARGTDTLVRREPRISAEIPPSDVQNWVQLGSHAARCATVPVVWTASGEE